ncbi:DNA-binding protein [Tranquillimonas alkanivorans]|uniref:Replication region DNA-binding N-term n=1 Tax=Tranquillimonas alkanivorans TaxID=441119 RepID=A0A1I5R0D0_9RHOB|nr:DNA-binding protein [Tranquillimonas alkanivorans]SFP51952.1 replication region DNA-binding N-term [Tranquillimonas alkanivorans]
MATKDTKKISAQREKSVRAAVAELEKKGERVTYSSVRREMGGGSFRDVGPILKAIAAEKEAMATAAIQVPEMPEDIADLATALWEGAYRRADEVAAADRRAHAEEVKSLRQELADRESDIATVEIELDDMKDRAEAAEERGSQLEQELAALRLVVAGLEGRLIGREEVSAAAGTSAETADAVDGRQIPLFAEEEGGQDAHTAASDGIPADKDAKPRNQKAA